MLSTTGTAGAAGTTHTTGYDAWGSGSMYDDNDPTSAHYHNIAIGSNANVYSAVAYQVDYAGKVALDYEYLMAIREVNSNSYDTANVAMRFAIYKNDTKIWPTDSDWYVYDCTQDAASPCAGAHEGYVDKVVHDVAAHLHKLAIFPLNVDVQSGDVITFRISRANNWTYHARSNPSITYKTVDENSWVAPAAPDTTVTKTSSSDHQAAYTTTNGSTIMFSGNWSYVSYSKDNMDTTYTLDTVRPMHNDFNKQPLPASEIHFTHSSKTAWDGKDTPDLQLGAVHPGAHPGWGYGNGTHTFSAHWNYPVGWRYVTEHAGKISIDITALSTLSAADQACFAIFHNGEMIWPNVGGSYTDKAAWFNSASQVANTRVDLLADAKETDAYASLSNVFVEKGDEITFLVKGNADYWSCRGNHMAMDITYKYIFTENTVFVSEKGSTNSEILEKGDSFTFPEYKGNNLLIFGGWDINDDGVADYQPGQSITLTGNVEYAGLENGAYVYEKGGKKVVYTKGDTFTFPEYTGELLGFRGWDANGDGGVDYAPGDEVTVTAEIAYSAVAVDLSFSRNEMTVVNNKLVMPFGWEFVAHNASNYLNVLPLDTAYNNGGTKDAWFMNDTFKKTGLWGGITAIGWFNQNDRDTELSSSNPTWAWGEWGSMIPSDIWNPALKFTAPNPGYITVSLDTIHSITDATSIAVFVSGNMVWPTEGGSYTNINTWYQLGNRDADTRKAYVVDVAALPNAELLENIFVAGGEAVEIVVKSSKTLGHGVLVEASIDYDELFQTDQPYIKIAGVKDPIILEEGERYTLPAYTGEGAFLGWDADGDGDVDYVDEETITMPGEVLLLNPVLAGSTSFGGNKPDSTADNSVVYNGGWKVGAYDKGAGKFIPFNYGQSADIRFSFNKKVWGENNILSMYGDGRFALSEEVMLDGRYQAAVQYTVEMSGNITVDFASLKLQRSANDWDVGGPVAGGFAIYHNGVKIAPVDADYYYYESDKIYAMGESGNDGGALLAMFRADDELTVDVKKGDTIEVRGFKNEISSRMFTINPMISYNEVPSKPIVTGGGVTVGQVPLKHGYYATNILTANQTFEFIDDNSVEYVEGFTLDIYASLNAPRTDYVKGDAGEEGFKIPYGVMMMYYNEKLEFGMVPATWVQDNTAEGAFFADVDFMFRLPAVSAKDLSTNYIVMPLIIYEDGSTYPNIEDTMQYGDIRDLLMLMKEEGELFSVSKYATLVLESPETDNEMKKIAGALLNYAAAANEYFDVEPFEFLVPDEMPVLPSITPKDVYNLTEFDGKAEISGATLVVEETISMRIYVDSTANISGWALQMDEDASFETPRNLKNLVLKRNSNGKYYVDVEIPTVNFGDAFYFRVVDQNGDQQSGVLTYSVESYVARMQGTGSAELLDLLDAMLTLCKVANDVA